MQLLPRICAYSLFGQTGIGGAETAGEQSAGGADRAEPIVDSKSRKAAESKSKFEITVPTPRSIR